MHKIAKSALERLVYSSQDDENPIIRAHAKVTDSLANAALMVAGKHPDVRAISMLSPANFERVRMSYTNPMEGYMAGLRASRSVARAKQQAREQLGLAWKPGQHFRNAGRTWVKARHWDGVSFGDATRHSAGILKQDLAREAASMAKSLPPSVRDGVLSFKRKIEDVADDARPGSEAERSLIRAGRKIGRSAEDTAAKFVDWLRQ